MYVDSLLLKFNSDEKQLARLSSQCSHLTASQVPPTAVAPCGGGWALRTEIGMTINLPGHPMSVTQNYLAMNDTYDI